MDKNQKELERVFLGAWEVFRRAWLKTSEIDIEDKNACVKLFEELYESSVSFHSLLENQLMYYYDLEEQIDYSFKNTGSETEKSENAAEFKRIFLMNKYFPSSESILDSRPTILECSETDGFSSFLENSELENYTPKKSAWIKISLKRLIFLSRELEEQEKKILEILDPYIGSQDSQKLFLYEEELVKA